MKARRIGLVAAIGIGSLLVLWLSMKRADDVQAAPRLAEDSILKPVMEMEEPRRDQRQEEGKAAQAPTESTLSSPLTRLPASGKNARRRVWVKAKYGSGLRNLGKDVPPAGEVFPPQGFTVTQDGKLLVLDSAKKRLVWYGADGEFERELPLDGLVAPAAVASADDGTLVVVDHRGVQTKGMLLLDANGQKKAELPQLEAVLWDDMYVVGKDIYYTKEGLTTVKAGDTSGSASDEVEGIYANEDDGVIPGHVAPDGQTVVSAGIDDFASGKFFVTAVRGVRPDHLFSRYYVSAAPLQGIPYVQSDAQGRIYVVLHAIGGRTLVCIDGRSGDLVGQVDLPGPIGSTFGTPFQDFHVMRTGGLVYQELSDDGSTYEWFNCHP
jgi:hypothetical protein